jgi:hypothetical protein
VLEQDHAADQRMRQTLALGGGEFKAGNVDHQRAEGQIGHGFSRMTKATA